MSSSEPDEPRQRTGTCGEATGTEQEQPGPDVVDRERGQQRQSIPHHD
jgi:hypothetical protein